MKKIFLVIIMLLPFMVHAEDEDITKNCQITIGDREYVQVTDEDYLSFLDFSKDDQIHISCDEEIKNVYIYYNVKSTEGNIAYNEKDDLVGQNKYLHELIKLDSPSKELTITYNDSFSIADIYLFNQNVPDWVEDWSTLTKADMMLFSTHADDEQLFFAGLLPTYVDKGKKIQVVYFTNHYNETRRYHELLEGLWALGIKYYPEESVFPDAWSDTLEWALRNLNSAGYTTDDAINFEVKMIRKYKPNVVVGHDEKGEYSHGQHILNADVLKEAYEKAGDSSYDGGSLAEYGTHQIDKLYLHLYEENKIVMNYDISLESFNGKTAYEVAKIGFSKHYSQQYTWFTAWLNGLNNEYTKATEIDNYIPDTYTGPFTPCNYGLYYTNVGEDINKDDMFENIIINSEDEPSVATIIDKAPETVNKLIEILSNINKEYLFAGLSIIILSLVGLLMITKKRK